MKNKIVNFKVMVNGSVVTGTGTILDRGVEENGNEIVIIDVLESTYYKKEDVVVTDLCNIL